MSRRERGAVTTATDTTLARLAADSALAAAQAQIVANVLTTNTGMYDFHLLSSTNYLPPGYNPFNISNILPRVVVMMTNLTLKSYESRFYLDLNRNGRDDPGTASVAGDPEWIGVLERPDLIPGPNNRFVARYAFFAQPVGNALDLNYIHNQTKNTGLGAADGFFRNQGVGSWELNLAAFLADLNAYEWAPNYQYNWPVSDSANGGVAFDDARSLLSWRYGYNYNLLAAANSYFTTNFANYPSGIDVYSDGPLQTTVDTNIALYADTTTLPWAGSDNTNRFFDLPSELFDGSKSSTNFVSRLLGATNSDVYTFYKLLDQIGTDSTADDPRMNLNYDNLATNGVVIPGAETNLIAWTPLRFFTNAANRLLTNYTARWLAADSNNYVAMFGTNAPLCFTNIPVLISNRFVYSPAVNRLLQLAANIYDATSTNFYPSVFRPVFNVVQNGTDRELFIAGYNYVSTVSGVSDPVLSQPTNAIGAAAVAGPVSQTVNIYDVPWIIGAKKGLPAFNQFSMRNDATVTRKLQLSKAHLTDAPNTFTTSQMYLFILGNSIGYSFWNSYANTYPNPVTIVARDNFSETITNDATPVSSYNVLLQTNKDISITNTILANNWPGTGWQASNNAPQISLPATNSFFIVSTNFYLGPTNTSVTNGSSGPPFAVYRFNYYNAGYANQYFDWNGTGWQTAANTLSYPQNGLTPPLPHFYLLATNQLQMFVLDNNHVIDYVHFILPVTNFDLTATNMDLSLPEDSQPHSGLGGLIDPDSTYTQSGQKMNIWSTNANTANWNRFTAQSMPSGVFNQVMVSLGLAIPNGYGQAFWVAPPNMPTGLTVPAALAQFFNGFFTSPSGKYEYPVGSGKAYYNTNLIVQAPYTAVRTVYNYSHWQANDPLVHYLASDLYCAGTNLTGLRFTNDIFQGVTQPDINVFTNRFSPWGLYAALAFNSTNVGLGGYNLQYQDPGVWRSDNWDFPTNKFPTPGWLGRIHRGTPWQTVYLKASDILTNNDGHNVNVGTNTWVQWTGDTQSASNLYFDAINSLPVSDRYLFDLFTTKINDNGRHGTLPVNVGSGGTNWDRGLAAWSALFSGMVVLNNSNNVATPIVSPAGISPSNSAVGRLVASINDARATITNADGVSGVFEHIGDVLRAPALTEQSPFLNLQDTNNISDALYEWLPQQSLGLLRLATPPRYVIYCYGQALRPAPNSVNLVGGANFGMVTNYQVVAESAARAVLRVNQNVFTNFAGVAIGTNYSTTIESYNVLGPD